MVTLKDITLPAVPSYLASQGAFGAAVLVAVGQLFEHYRLAAELRNLPVVQGREALFRHDRDLIEKLVAADVVSVGEGELAGRVFAWGEVLRASGGDLANIGPDGGELVAQILAALASVKATVENTFSSQGSSIVHSEDHSLGTSKRDARLRGPSLDGATVAVAPHVRYANGDGGDGIVMDLQTTELISLNRTAALLWELLQESSLAEVREAFVAEVGAARADVADDYLSTFVAALEDKGLVTIAP